MFWTWIIYYKLAIVCSSSIYGIDDDAYHRFIVQSRRIFIQQPPCRTYSAQRRAEIDIAVAVVAKPWLSTCH